MRRTPDKDTIIKLRGEGLTFKEIGERYGVSTRAIFWALHQVPKYHITETCHIPQHVIDHWRNEWGWSDEQIREKILLFNQSLARQGSILKTRNPQAKARHLPPAVAHLRDISPRMEGSIRTGAAAVRGDEMNATPARREAVFNYIKRYQTEAGYPPTIIEIGQALGLAKTTVHYHIGKLIAEGRLERVASSARAMRVL